MTTRPAPLEWSEDLEEEKVLEYVHRVSEWEITQAHNCTHYEGPAPSNLDAFPHTCKNCDQPHAWHTTCGYRKCTYVEHRGLT